MTKRMFIISSVVTGVAAFFIFRRFTHPLDRTLDWLLLQAFVGSGLLCAASFSAVCYRVRSRWLRLVAALLLLPAFTLLSGFGVFGATRIVFDSRPRSADDGGLLYGDTSGIQMLGLDHDLWFYVIGAVTLPLGLLFALGVVAALTGIHEPHIKNMAA
jgi:hypothetical protein